MVLQPPFSQWAAMSFLRGALKSSEKTSSVLIVLLVFVSLLLVGESSYGTPLMRTSEILQLQVGGVFSTGHLCVLIKSIFEEKQLISLLDKEPSGLFEGPMTPSN